MKDVKRLLSYLGCYKKTAWSVVLLTCMQVAGTVTLPCIMATILDDGLQGQNVPYLMKMSILMLIVTLATCTFGVLAVRQAGIASSGFGDNLRLAMMEKLCDFSTADVGHFSKASFIDRMTADVNDIQATLGMVLSTALSAPFTILFILIVTLRIDKELSLIFLAAVPLFSLISFFIMRIAMPYFSQNAAHQDRMNRVLMEDLISIRLVKAFVRESFLTKQFRKAAEDVKTCGLKAERITKASNSVQAFIVNLCVILILWFGGQKVLGKQLDVGELFSFVTYADQILYQISLISIVIVPVISSAVSVRRVLEVLDREPEVTDRSAKEDLTVPDGAVTFEHVFFDYGDVSDEKEMLLQDISLTIRNGEAVGVVGATGSGKTTMVNLIARLFDVKQGRILLGGVDIQKLTFKKLRAAVSFAPQKSFLFSGSLKENLLCGKKDATTEEMVRACRNACIYDFVEGQDKGFEMRIEEGGGNVSGGQRQRLCLARALIRDSRLLVLDDCTSALDKTTERAVIEHLVNDYTDRTRILISGKISSLKRMDRIIVMDRGQISGIGTHEELLKNNAIYRDLCVSQGEA